MEEKKFNSYVLEFKTYFKKLSLKKQEEIINALMDVYFQQQKEEIFSKKRIMVQSEEDCDYSEICAMLD